MRTLQNRFVNMSFYSIAPFIKEYYPQYYSIESYPASECARIHKVAQEWGVFSNFAGTPIEIDGVVFKNAEQIFQIMKFKDAEQILAVYKAGNPKMTARHWEKTHRRKDWGEMLVDAIKFCLQKKYEQSQIFRDKIVLSRGRYIVEDQTTFPKKTPDTWGVKLIGETFIGPNLLGRLLMELRENGRLEYYLPDDALGFIETLKNSPQKP